MTVQKLQYIQNNAARGLMRVQKHDYTHKCITRHALSYLQELKTPQTFTSSLRSTGRLLLRVLKTRLSTKEDQAISSPAPPLWNTLLKKAWKHFNLECLFTVGGKLKESLLLTCSEFCTTVLIVHTQLYICNNFHFVYYNMNIEVFSDIPGQATMERKPNIQPTRGGLKLLLACWLYPGEGRAATGTS